MINFTQIIAGSVYMTPRNRQHVKIRLANTEDDIASVPALINTKLLHELLYDSLKPIGIFDIKHVAFRSLKKSLVDNLADPRTTKETTDYLVGEAVGTGARKRDLLIPIVDIIKNNSYVLRTWDPKMRDMVITDVNNVVKKYLSQLNPDHTLVKLAKVNGYIV